MLIAGIPSDRLQSKTKKPKQLQTKKPKAAAMAYRNLETLILIFVERKPAVVVSQCRDWSNVEKIGKFGKHESKER